MTISEFKDEEIVYIWHRLNECAYTFVRGYNSDPDDEEAYNEDYIEDSHRVWRVFNNEVVRRGLDPDTFHIK